MRVHSQITNSQQRGSALTEFAIMVPLFLAMIYGSIFLSDLGAVRLKAQEIARFLTWSFSVQPLSDFSEFKHSTLFSEARTRSETQVWELYSDLDSASDRVIPVAGKTQQSMLAVYVPPTASDMRNLKVQMVPEAGNVEFAEPLSGMYWVLQLLGIGSDLNQLVMNPYGRLRFNIKGAVTGRAKVRILPILGQDGQNQLAGLAAIGGERGADLSLWNPRGRILKDTSSRYIQNTLIVDSWRHQAGFSSHPKNRGYVSGPYARADKYGIMVQEVNERALTALPMGTVINAVFNFMAQLNSFPGTELKALLGIPAEEPKAHLVSRPYTSRRSERLNLTGAAQPGQFSLFREVDAPRYNDLSQENRAVRNFETAPLYVDPSDPSESGYLKALNQRGRYFLGCPDPEKRGCWE